jgi:hypothetical protein
MNSGNWTIILGIVIVLTFAISTYANSYAAFSGSEIISATASAIGELYMSVVGIGILIFFFVLFMYIFGTEDTKTRPVLSLIVTYIITVLFVVLLTIFMVSLAKIGLVGGKILSFFVALRFPLIPVILIGFMVVLYLIVYFLLNYSERMVAIKAEK